MKRVQIILLIFYLVVFGQVISNKQFKRLFRKCKRYENNRKKLRTRRLVGGTNNFQPFPLDFLVKIERNGWADYNFENRCMGTWISKNVLLTKASCLYVWDDEYSGWVRSKSIDLYKIESDGSSSFELQVNTSINNQNVRFHRSHTETPSSYLENYRGWSPQVPDDFDHIFDEVSNDVDLVLIKVDTNSVDKSFISVVNSQEISRPESSYFTFGYGSRLNNFTEIVDSEISPDWLNVDPYMYWYSDWVADLSLADYVQGAIVKGKSTDLSKIIIDSDEVEMGLVGDKGAALISFSRKCELRLFGVYDRNNEFYGPEIINQFLKENDSWMNELS